MNQSQIYAALRHVASAAGGAAVAFGLMKSADVTTIVAALDQINQAVASIMTVVGPLVTLAMAYLAARKSGKIGQAASTQASPTETVVTSDPKVAAAAPGAILGKPGATVQVVVPAAPAAPKP